MNNKKFYISGPMSGIANENKEAFNAMEKQIKEKFPKAVVLNPARHPAGLKYETYIEYAMIDIADSDLLVLLPGWKNSGGACREYIAARDQDKDFVNKDFFNNLKRGEMMGYTYLFKDLDLSLANKQAECYINNTSLDSLQKIKAGFSRIDECITNIRPDGKIKGLKKYHELKKIICDN